eukprot:6932481-Alexandrium_andersonii.AAC.1
MAQRQSADYYNLPDEQPGMIHAGDAPDPDTGLEHLLPDVSDADVLAEWDRKRMQPDYVPLLRGRRLEHMQG